MAQNGLIDTQLEELLAVDGDHRNPLQIGAQKPLIGLDVALAELEVVLRADAFQHLARVVAQTAPRTAIEDDLGHRSGPSPVA
jgi:hypothetical protein